MKLSEVLSSVLSDKQHFRELNRHHGGKTASLNHKMFIVLIKIDNSMTVFKYYLMKPGFRTREKCPGVLYE